MVFTGTVTAGRHTGDTTTKITSGISYLLGTPLTATTGLIESLLLTHYPQTRVTRNQNPAALSPRVTGPADRTRRQ